MWEEEFISKTVTAGSGSRGQGTGLPVLKNELLLVEMFQAKSCQWRSLAAGCAICQHYGNSLFY